MAKLPSGQRQQTVNLSGYPFDGSNPSFATILFRYIDGTKIHNYAGVTQLVECQPSKLNVASSNLVARSIKSLSSDRLFLCPFSMKLRTMLYLLKPLPGELQMLRKRLLVNSLIVGLYLISFSSYSDVITRNEFLKILPKYIGVYSVVGKASKSCLSGSLSFIDSKNKGAGITLFNKVFFGPFAEGVNSIKEEGYCVITETYEYTSNSLKQTTEVHNCQKENKADESKSTQELIFGKKGILYKSIEAGVECRLARNDGSKE